MLSWEAVGMSWLTALWQRLAGPRPAKQMILTGISIGGMVYPPAYLLKCMREAPKPPHCHPAFTWLFLDPRRLISPVGLVTRHGGSREVLYREVPLGTEAHSPVSWAEICDVLMWVGVMPSPSECQHGMWG